MSPRRAAKVDANQRQIVEHMRGLGCSVACTHSAGEGFPDLVIGQYGINALVEVKDGSKPPSDRVLTPDQKEFHDAWRGQITVVNNIQEALQVAIWLRRVATAARGMNR